MIIFLREESHLPSHGKLCAMSNFTKKMTLLVTTFFCIHEAEK